MSTKFQSKCIICHDRGTRGFFRFPQKENQRQIWLNQCGLESVKDSERICSKHFQSNSFMPRRSENQPIRLKDSALPSINLPHFVNANDYVDVASEITIETDHGTYWLNANDTEMIEVTDIGEDFVADQWISWVRDKPRKNTNAIYLYPQLWDPDFDVHSAKFHDDHVYVNKRLHELNEEMENQQKSFQLEKEKFLEEKKKLKLEKLNLQRSLNKANRDLRNLQDKTTAKGKAHMGEMVRERLKNHFSEGTLDLILDKNRKFSKKWSNKDLCFAMLLKMISPKSLKLLRKSNLLPLPANSTLKQKFSFMHVTPGYVDASLEYLKKLVPKLKPGEELACLAFDEMHLTEKAEWDRKMDAMLGPNKQANVFMVRSLYGKWKFPVYVDFEPTKNPEDPKLPKGSKKLPKIPKFLLLQIIVQLEAIGIKILSTVCDMGADNQGLASELGITPENITFPNPWDPDRSIYFSYDFVHGFKNLRNHLLDDHVKINGITISKVDILKLRGITGNFMISFALKNFAWCVRDRFIKEVQLVDHLYTFIVNSY